MTWAKRLLGRTRARRLPIRTRPGQPLAGQRVSFCKADFSISPTAASRCLQVSRNLSPRLHDVAQ